MGFLHRKKRRTKKSKIYHFWNTLVERQHVFFLNWKKNFGLKTAINYVYGHAYSFAENIFKFVQIIQEKYWAAFFYPNRVFQKWSIFDFCVLLFFCAEIPQKWHKKNLSEKKCHFLPPHPRGWTPWRPTLYMVKKWTFTNMVMLYTVRSAILMQIKNSKEAYAQNLRIGS